jgi:ABC-type nitrate/sulfonate/bicarbonate transport system substrate-binding protein
MAVTTFRGYMILSRVGVGQMSSSAPAETPVQTFKQQANAVTTVVAEVFAPPPAASLGGWTPPRYVKVSREYVASTKKTMRNDMFQADELSALTSVVQQAEAWMREHPVEAASAS